MDEVKPNPFAKLVEEARQRLADELNGQTEVLERFERASQELREGRARLKEAIERELAVLEEFKPPEPEPPPSPEALFEDLLASVRNVMTATVPEQIFDALTEESARMRVRSAVFDVRGKAAWGVSARGFDPPLSGKNLHALAIPLNHANPFAQVFETGGNVDATVGSFKKYRNLVEKLQIPRGAPVLLLPIRAAGSVAAIFYADMGESGLGLPVNALNILTECAGAQLDRLMALSGEFSPASASAEKEAVEEAEAGSSGEAEMAEAASVEPAPEQPATESVPSPELEAASAAFQAAAGEGAALPTSPSAQEAEPPAETAPAMAAGAATAAPEAAPLSEADEKVLKDARRFSKLLVSEIELYNKAKVADGRKGHDLYKRLKSDIERSRQTYEKRFGKTIANQYDFFHEELVKVLATNDPSLLGSDYPGSKA